MTTKLRRSMRIAAALLLGLPACSSTPKVGESSSSIARDDLLTPARTESAPPDLVSLHFDTDRADLRAEAEQKLEAQAKLLREHPEWTVVIEGHADERGSAGYNQELGMRRAAAARDFLEQSGIDPGRVRESSFGESQPVRTEHNESAWRVNRRAEIRIANL